MKGARGPPGRQGPFPFRSLGPRSGYFYSVVTKDRGRALDVLKRLPGVVDQGPTWLELRGSLMDGEVCEVLSSMEVAASLVVASAVTRPRQLCQAGLPRGAPWLANAMPRALSRSRSRTPRE